MIAHVPVSGTRGSESKGSPRVRDGSGGDRENGSGGSFGTHLGDKCRRHQGHLSGRTRRPSKGRILGRAGSCCLTSKSDNRGSSIGCNMRWMTQSTNEYSTHMGYGMRGGPGARKQEVRRKEWFDKDSSLPHSSCLASAFSPVNVKAVNVGPVDETKRDNPDEQCNNVRIVKRSDKEWATAKECPRLPLSTPYGHTLYLFIYAELT